MVTTGWMWIEVIIICETISIPGRIILTMNQFELHLLICKTIHSISSTHNTTQANIFITEYQIISTTIKYQLIMIKTIHYSKTEWVSSVFHFVLFVGGQIIRGVSVLSLEWFMVWYLVVLLFFVKYSDVQFIICVFNHFHY